jgi:hypothetical protein
MTPARVAFLVVGTPRSGTTLVQRLACELPGVAIPYETHFFTKGLDLLEAQGALPLGPGALARGLEAYAALPHLEGAGLRADAVVARLGDRPGTPLAVFDAVVAELTGGGEVLGEKTPGHLHWAGRLASARPELRVVAVVRDPRAVAASQRAVPWGAGPADLAARRWLDDQRALDALVAQLGPRLLLVRYEDVVVAPDATRVAIGELLGRAPGAAPEAAGAAGPAGASLRLPWEVWKSDAEQPVTAARRDAWAEVLTVGEADRIMAICAPLLDRFGYGAGLPSLPRRVWALATAGRAARRRARALDRRRAALRARVAGTDPG